MINTQKALFLFISLLYIQASYSMMPTTRYVLIQELQDLEAKEAEVKDLLNNGALSIGMLFGLTAGNQQRDARIKAIKAQLAQRGSGN